MLQDFLPVIWLISGEARNLTWEFLASKVLCSWLLTPFMLIFETSKTGQSTMSEC